MRVISKKDTKKLVKGCAYEVYNLVQQNTSTRQWFRPEILVKLNDKVVSRFNPKDFTTETGEELPIINWMSDECRLKSSSEDAMIDHTIKAGDYVVAKRNQTKSLQVNQVYQVKEAKVTQRTTSHGYTYHDIKIRIDGSDRFYSPYTFRKCSAEKARAIQLNTVLDEETGVKKIDKSLRKIDQYVGQEREQILIWILLSSMCDPNRNNMSVLEWACKKSGKLYSVEQSDFTNVLTRNLQTIISEWS